MEIMKQEWNSLTIYDEELLQLEHYRHHPTMLPFIGRHYPETQILLVGESHYLDPDENEDAKIMENWYHMPTEHYKFKYPDNINTRKVIHNYLTLRRSKAHSMFRNPAKALIEAWELDDVNDSEAFTAFAFMNYFQRPEASSGKSINLIEGDETKSFENLNSVIEILDPAIVLFLSKKAFDSYKNCVKGRIDSRITYVSHPTSEYWNKSNGKEEAIRRFKEIQRFSDFSLNGHLPSDTAIAALRNYHIIEKHHKRFIDDEITVSIYPDTNSNAISEVVWHIVDQDIKLGIGYIVERKLIWIWDYTNKVYLNEDDLARIPRLGNLYCDVQAIIHSIP